MDDRLAAFVDRERELAELRDFLARRPGLAIVRGRRRVGKSFLLAHGLDGERLLYYQADEQPEAAQLDMLGAEIGRLAARAGRRVFERWDDLLDAVDELVADGPLVVVLDEFQWLRRAQPAIESILQRRFDRWQHAGAPVALLLSGSALSLMDSLLHPAAPLHGRSSWRPLLTPLDFRAARGFAPRLGAEASLRRYAILGGMPQYQVWAGPTGVADVLRRGVLRKNAALYDEPRHLLRAEESIDDPGTYLSVLQAIARGATRQSELLSQTHSTTGNLASKLARLHELGYVRRRAPLERDGASDRRRSQWVVDDPFVRFWFRHVHPNRSRLDLGLVEPVAAEIEADLDTFMGPVFEDCCRTWLARYAPPDLADGVVEVGAWWSRTHDVEVDVVAVGGDRYRLLGACRWSRRAGTDALASLDAGAARLGAPAVGARRVVFARGFAPALRERAVREDIALVTAEELVG